MTAPSRRTAAVAQCVSLMPRTITTRRSYQQTFDARSGRLAANGSHDVLVREDVTRMPLEDDLAAVDRVEAIGDAPGIDATGLRDLEVLFDGEIVEDSAILGRVADAKTRSLVRGESRDVPASERHAARAQREQAHDAVDGGRLAGAVAADEADRFPFAHPQRHGSENLRLTTEGVDALQLKHGWSRAG